MHRIIRVFLVAAFTAVGLSGVQSPASAGEPPVPEQCEMTGRVREVSLCIQAQHSDTRVGRCPRWQKVLIGIGEGGKWLEEANGAIIRHATIRLANGDYVGNHFYDNIYENPRREDSYRRFYDLPTRPRSRYLRVSVYVELLIDHGKNRLVSFTARLYPWNSC